MLRDAMAPSVTVAPSAHPTTVVLGDGKTTLAKLEPGQGATFHGDVRRVEDEDTGRVTSTVTWTRASAPSSPAARRA